MNHTSPKRADKAKEIAQAALDQFTQLGFVAASLEKIASAAGIGKSTIYEYYKNKEELFVAAVEAACDGWFNDVDEICRQTQDPIERLEGIAANFMECPDYPPKAFHRFYFDILMQTVMEGGVFYTRKHFIREMHQKMIRKVVDILLTGVSTGTLRPEIAKDAQKITITYMAFLDGMVLNSLMTENYIEVNDQIAFFLNSLEPLLRVTRLPEDDDRTTQIQEDNKE